MKIRRQRVKIKRPLLINGNETSKEIMRSHYDPNGSYTGIPNVPRDEVPVQDADDL